MLYFRLNFELQCYADKHEYEHEHEHEESCSELKRYHVKHEQSGRSVFYGEYSSAFWSHRDDFTLVSAASLYRGNTRNTNKPDNQYDSPAYGKSLQYGDDEHVGSYVRLDVHEHGLA